MLSPRRQVHRLHDAAGFAQLKIRHRAHLVNGMPGEPFRTSLPRGSLLGHRLSPVFTVFRNSAPVTIRVRPGATRAVVAAFLVQFEQRMHALLQVRVFFDML